MKSEDEKAKDEKAKDERVKDEKAKDDGALAFAYLRRRRLLTTFAALFVAGLLPLVYAFFVEPARLVVREVRIEDSAWPSDLSGLKLVAISDLHVGAPFSSLEKLRRIVAEVNRQQPDVVFIAGDFLIQDVLGGKYVEPQAIAGELRNLRATSGVYAVLGNHDWWGDGEGMWRALESAGVRVLENDVARVERGRQVFWIAGLADFWTRTQNIESTIGRIPPGETIIALTHNPDIFPRVPRRVLLTVAGHTHGGQVNLPLVGRRVVPSSFGQRYAQGHIFEGEHHLFVTPGTGSSILPVRFRVPPEISVLVLTHP